MNQELIQKLFSKSCWDEQAEVDIEDWCDVEKFAELIVRECAKIADIADENECEWIGGNILTRFGVKE